MIDSTVEIDHARGVIYVHDKNTGATILRICNLPAPIPLNVQFIDVTNKIGSSYTAEAPLPDKPPSEVRIHLSGIPDGLPPGTYPAEMTSFDLSEQPTGDRLDIGYRILDCGPPETPDPGYSECP